MPSTAEFRVLDPTQPRKVVDPAIGRLAQAVTTDAQSRTPVRSGRLMAGWRVERSGTATYHVVNDVPYARFVEHGTRHMRAEPMLGPAVMAARARTGS